MSYGLPAANLPSLPQNFSGFLKRSFVMLSLTKTNMTVDYYEADWDCWSAGSIFNPKRGTCEYKAPVKAWTEVF